MERGSRGWSATDPRPRASGGELRTVVGVGTLLDLEELVQAEHLVVGRQPLLVQLQLPQALALLVAGRAGVLHQVEPRLGGVVAQRAVVDARLAAVAAVLLLQVLWTTKREGTERRWLDDGSAKQTQLDQKGLQHPVGSRLFSFTSN